ncbi:MAG: hypothetical protein JJU42_12850 [Rhodobacteraceae bacterium]|nr:hypothetical protein [Paracoccaceae bacterium]
MANRADNLENPDQPLDRKSNHVREEVERLFRPGLLAGVVPDTAMRAQFIASPVSNWAEACATTVILLERFARIPEGQDERMQKLIRHALRDVARLLRRDERK